MVLNLNEADVQIRMKRVGILKTEGKVYKTYLAFISSVDLTSFRPNNKQICLNSGKITSKGGNSQMVDG
jgi:hypothetical protein